MTNLATPTASSTQRDGAAWRGTTEPILIYLPLFIFAVLVGAPFVYMITGSFKTNGEIFNYPVTLWVQNPTLSNYQRLLSGAEIPYLTQMGNSVIVAVSQTFLTLLIASMVGWGFAKYTFWGRNFLTIFPVGYRYYSFSGYIGSIVSINGRY